MGKNEDIYRKYGKLSYGIGTVGLNNIRDHSNPKHLTDLSFEKCLVCGKVISPTSMHDSEICIECAKKKGKPKAKELSISDTLNNFIECSYCHIMFYTDDFSQFCDVCSEIISECKYCGKNTKLKNMHAPNLCEDCSKIIRECEGCKELFSPSDMHSDKLCKECSKKLRECKSCSKIFTFTNNYEECFTCRNNSKLK